MDGDETNISSSSSILVYSKLKRPFANTKSIALTDKEEQDAKRAKT